MNALTIPFGISSQARNLPDIDGEPFIVARSRGSHIFDSRDRDYVDYGMAMGANLLGHAHPAVVEACTKALQDGSMPGFRHNGEEIAAAALVKIGGERVTRATFTTTGTEAVHLACRAARYATGRRLVAKAVGGYDGWFDDMLFGLVGSPEAERTNQRPERDDITLFRVNEIDDLEMLFAERGRDLAAILVEPMLGNTGSLVPDRAYFERLTEFAQQNGTMIISDEVMVGLRLGFTLVSEQLGLRPDLVTMGKAIGSGVPVAAVLGTNEAFEGFDRNVVSRGGTYHGNPLVTAAVSATTEVLSKADYGALFAYGAKMRREIAALFAEQDIPFSTSGFDSVFSIWFTTQPPHTYDEAKAAIRPEISQQVFEIVRKSGVITLPSPWGRIFISFAHGSDEFRKTTKAYKMAVKALKAN